MANQKGFKKISCTMKVRFKLNRLVVNRSNVKKMQVS